MPQRVQWRAKAKSARAMPRVIVKSTARSMARALVRGITTRTLAARTSVAGTSAQRTLL